MGLVGYMTDQMSDVSSTLLITLVLLLDTILVKQSRQVETRIWM